MLHPIQVHVASRADITVAIDLPDPCPCESNRGACPELATSVHGNHGRAAVPAPKL